MENTTNQPSVEIVPRKEESLLSDLYDGLLSLSKSAKYLLAVLLNDKHSIARVALGCLVGCLLYLYPPTLTIVGFLAVVVAFLHHKDPT